MGSKEYITLLSDMAHEYGVLDIAKEVLDNPGFEAWSGSAYPDQHHYGDGGLLRHTYQVCHLCQMNARVSWARDNKSSPLDESVLFLAALYHDVGKMWDYEHLDIYPHWFPTHHKRLIHHISRSAIEWSKAAEKHEYDKGKADRVLHAILSHHGTREWGSPVSPYTKEAWILHFCDGLSARMDDAGRWDLINKK